MIVVAHSGCRPIACRWRNGHHDTPQTKALTSRASTGPAEPGRGWSAVVMRSMGIAARDLEQLFDFLSVLHQVAPVPAPDQPAGAGDEDAEDRDRAEHGQAAT